MPYEFILKDNNQKAYRLFVWFLFFLHIIAAAVFIINATDASVKLSVYILLGVYTVVSFIYFFSRKQKKAFINFSSIMALLYASFWLKHVGVIALIIFVAVYLFVTLLKDKKTIVFFSVEGARVKRIFKTIIYPWKEIDNVILKDNLLTIDLRSNKLIQAEIAGAGEQADELSFNRFCKDQLQKNA